MRVAMVLVAAIAAVVAGACDHKRAPPDRGRPASIDAAPAPPPPEPTDEAGGPGAGAGSGSGSAGSGSGLALAQANAAQFKACNDVGAHVVDVMIASAPAASRPDLANQRATLIQGMLEPCVTQPWSPEALACLGGAKDQAGIEACRPLVQRKPG
jgi:hypothetical protein